LAFVIRIYHDARFLNVKYEFKLTMRSAYPSFSAGIT
jgi:hypothetical protein